MPSERKVRPPDTPEGDRDEERLRYALEGANDGLWDWDIPRQQLYLSPRYKAILGYRPDEEPATCATWSTLVHADDLPAILPPFNAMFTGAADSFAAEYRMRSKAGDWVWVLGRGKVVKRDDAGRPLRAVGTLSDITQRKRDEQRFRYALEASNDGIWDWDVRSGRIFRNHRYHRIFGYRPGEIPGVYSAWETAIHPDDRERVLAGYRDQVAGKRAVFEGEYRMRSKTGDWVWIHERAKVVERDADGAVLRVVGAQTDITQSRQAADQLRAQEERLRAALSASLTGTYRWEIQSGRLLYDESMLRLIGIEDAREGTLQQFYERVTPEDREHVRAKVARCLADGEDLQVDYRVRLPGGAVRWFAERGKLIRDETGAPSYMTGACTDITDRKLAEAELARSRDRAEAANRAKSEFLANMSHEFRTPLNAIIGFTDAMLSGYAGELTRKQREYVGDVNTSGQHLLQIVNDVLDLSKVEAGKLDLCCARLDPAEIIGLCVGLMEARARAGGLTLEVDLPQAPPAIWADELRFRQILINLVSNAVKFTPPGGRVTVRATATEDRVRIEVSDTGIGMKPAEIALALEPFRQVDGSLARRYEGTGLGLPLVKSLTEMHGGTLEIETSPGRGTTVAISLPRARPNSQGQAA